MCTVSWIHQPGGYHLFCNRDEKRTRGIAQPPRLAGGEGGRYVAPLDSDSGGTWIAVNAYGVSLCLLNRGSAPALRSRGHVIPDLIWARCVDDCAFLLQQADLTPFAPFTLLLLEPEEPALVAEWDGNRLTAQVGAPAPLTSSSFEPESVCGERLHHFARLAPCDPEAHFRFHASHQGTSPAHAPCMHRNDAHTVSFSHILVTPDQIRFAYLPSAPCVRSASKEGLSWDSLSPSPSLLSPVKISRALPPAR